MVEILINQCGTTITLGASGDTINLASGASQSGFGRTGTVDWDTTAKTASFTAVSGNGYFVNTTSGVITVTLPASPSPGDIVSISDYAGTFSSNNVIVGRNGSNIRGSAADFALNVTNQTATLIYVDGTQGWNLTQESNNVNNFVAATGGTITECGDYKIHTFTGPGTFTVSSAGNPLGSTTVDYLVVAGGGGGGGTPCGGNQRSGGAGAGGYRESSGAASGCYSVSPLGSGVSSITVTATAFPITVGGGGVGTYGSNTNGSNSVFSTITSAGGGKGASEAPAPAPLPAGNGGSGGGGASSNTCGGTGNTPPVSPPQGNAGGSSTGYFGIGGGGGGAGEAGGTDSTGAGGWRFRYSNNKVQISIGNMSEVKVNKITPTADCGTVTLGDSGDTVAIPAGVTLTSGGALQNSGTITNTGTITGVAITGTIDNQVNWQTTVKTTGFTATAGEGYFCDTTSAAFTVTLPASPSAGDLVGIKDYANTADTNNITIGRNGSNIEGVANDFVINS
jgi:hypothetical protein